LIFKLCTHKFGGIVYFVEKRAHFFHWNVAIYTWNEMNIGSFHNSLLIYYHCLECDNATHSDSCITEQYWVTVSTS
jgi:hypothetical protein